MPTICVRQASAAECRHPGDFAWRVCAEHDADGDCIAYRSPADGERPTHIYLVETSGQRAFLALAPEKQSNGASWDWDGDLDRPTLSPSIDARDDKGVGWHGFLRGGMLIDA